MNNENGYGVNSTPVNNASNGVPTYGSSTGTVNIDGLNNTTEDNTTVQADTSASTNVQSSSTPVNTGVNPMPTSSTGYGMPTAPINGTNGNGVNGSANTPKNNKNMIYIIIIAVLVVAIIVLAVLISSDKKNANNSETETTNVASKNEKETTKNTTTKKTKSSSTTSGENLVCSMAYSQANIEYTVTFDSDDKATGVSAQVTLDLKTVAGDDYTDEQMESAKESFCSAYEAAYTEQDGVTTTCRMNGTVGVIDIAYDTESDDSTFKTIIGLDKDDVKKQLEATGATCE